MDALGHVNNTRRTSATWSRRGWSGSQGHRARRVRAGHGAGHRQRELQLTACRSSIRATSRCACSSGARALERRAATTRSLPSGKTYRRRRREDRLGRLQHGQVDAAAGARLPGRCARSPREAALTNMLWEPSPERIAQANVTAFAAAVVQQARRRRRRLRRALALVDRPQVGLLARGLGVRRRDRHAGRRAS